MYKLKGLKLSILGALERGLHEENVSQLLQEAEDLKRMCLTFTASCKCKYQVSEFMIWK
jgi:hypothetical protein